MTRRIYSRIAVRLRSFEEQIEATPYTRWIVTFLIVSGITISLTFRLFWPFRVIASMFFIMVSARVVVDSFPEGQDPMTFSLEQTWSAFIANCGILASVFALAAD